MKNKLLLIANDLEQLAIWHDPFDGVKEIEKRILDYASMLKTTARELSKRRLETHSHKPTQ